MKARSHSHIALLTHRGSSPLPNHHTATPNRSFRKSARDRAHPRAPRAPPASAPPTDTKNPQRTISFSKFSFAGCTGARRPPALVPSYTRHLVTPLQVQLYLAHGMPPRWSPSLRPPREENLRLANCGTRPRSFNCHCMAMAREVGAPGARLHSGPGSVH